MVEERQSTGVGGLDRILDGGLLPGNCVLVSGAAGTGKTTLGLQFLCAGASQGEGGVYITFEEFPEQIYRDATSFGMDLQGLEQARRLQVISLAPEVLLQEAVSPDGLLEELRAEVGMRRVVIDSLSLLTLGSCSPEAARLDFYMVRNAFRRLGVTALFLDERAPSGEVGQVQEFVADTVIYLTYDNMERHRLRHVEVRKHRGSNFLGGQHVFVFGDGGMKVLPALNRIPDLTFGDVVPTGLARLDECLGGGIPRGSAIALNVNSKCNYRYLLGTIMAAHLAQGDGLISGRSALKPPSEIASVIQQYGFDPVRLGRENRWAALEYVDRPVPPDLAPFVVRLPEEAAAHQEAADDAVMSRWRGEHGSASHWLWTVDLNTAMRKVGEDAVMAEWTSRVAAAKYYGHTGIAICNFEEMGASMASFVQRTAAGILRTWFDGRYQYLQVQKAPNGRMSEPFLIEYTETPPFMELW